MNDTLEKSRGKLSYFSHDTYARKDKKIRRLIFKHGPAGYGVYWILAETLHIESRIDFVDLPIIADDEKIDPAFLKTIVDYCTSEECLLFPHDNTGFWSDRVNRNLKQIQVFVDAGKKGASKRWGNKNNNHPNEGANWEGNSNKQINKQINKETNKETGHEMTDEEKQNYLKPENIKNLQTWLTTDQALKTHLLGFGFTEQEIDLAMGKKF